MDAITDTTPKQSEIWEHWKHKSLYKIVLLALNTAPDPDNQVLMVVYRPFPLMVDDDEQFFCRPVTNFLEYISPVGYDYKGPRFVKSA